MSDRELLMRGIFVKGHRLALSQSLPWTLASFSSCSVRARFMVTASVWGFQGVCSSHPQRTAESLRINRQPTSVFPTTRKKAHDSQCITCSLSASLSPPSAAGGGCFPSTVDLGGLVMSSSRATGEESDAQWQDPQNMSSSFSSDRSSSVSSDGSIQGLLPQWAIGRTEQLVGPPKLLTLVIIQKDSKVLLGMKKRGFGKGYFNGFGGKVEKGETVDAAAARELQEEAGVTPVDMSERGILTFHFDNDPVAWEVHVYHVSEIVGDPCETEEMAPRWFSESEIPYETMWQDDILWYPEFLKGRHFKGTFYFENTTTLVAHSLQVIPT